MPLTRPYGFFGQAWQPVLHNWTWPSVWHHVTGPSPVANSTQLDCSLLRQREERKTGDREADEDSLADGWEGEKEAGKGKDYGRFQGRKTGNSPCMSLWFPCWCSYFSESHCCD